MRTRLSTKKIKPGMTTALSLVVALGAYCPVVKFSSEQRLADEKAHAKRQTRSMLSRGKFGASIMAMFAKHRVGSRARG